MPDLIPLLEITTCVALILSAAIFVRNGTVLARTIHALHAQEKDCQGHARLKLLADRISRLEGMTTQAHIQSKVASKMSAMAHDKAVEAQTKVGAIEKSTHRIHFQPLDKVLERNKEQIEAVNNILNPSNEGFDWFGEPEEDELDD